MRRTVRVTLALSLIGALSGCVLGSGAPASTGAVVSGPGRPPATVLQDNASQPRTATYSCADGGMMTIQNLGTSLRLLGPDGVTEELPASPAGQTSRYGQSHDAIVIDGNEALVMTGGHPPMPCTR
ncbi:MAG: hypothetical protein ACTHNH_07790 [Mesorhizobium sp.]